MDYALITGGSRGIGRAICIKLAQKGYNILINYNSNEAAALETKQLVEYENGKAEILKFDVANRAETKMVLDNWLSENN